MFLDATPAWITALDTLKWPGLILIIALIIIFLFKAQLGAFLSRSKQFKAGNFQIDTDPHAQQAAPKNEVKSAFENAAQLFRADTMNYFQAIVQKDTSFEQLPNDTEKFKTLLKYATTLCTIRRFEFIYDAIYGSQILLLQCLNCGAINDFGIFDYYYSQAKENNPHEYQNITLHDYSQYLYSYDLVTNVQNNGVEITALGNDFLKYLVDSRMNIYRPL